MKSHYMNLVVESDENMKATNNFGFHGCYLSCNTTKSVFGISDQVCPRLACKAIEGVQ